MTDAHVQQAQARLVELLSARLLRTLVGEKLMEAWKAVTKGGPRPDLSPTGLALILLRRHGDGLLADPELRRQLGKRAGVESPARWHPGKRSALQFTRALGFPDAYAGSASEDRRADVEWLRAHPQVPALADFQQEVLDKVREKLDRLNRPRAILSLPTGAGKTRTAVEYVCGFVSTEANAGRHAAVLWVAHTEELLEQAIESLKQVWAGSPGVPELRLERRFGGYGDDPLEVLAAPQTVAQCLVTTPQRLLKDLERWTVDLPEDYTRWREHLSLLVIDEAHRAASSQYVELLQRLCRTPDTLRVLGLTATPWRAEYRRDPDLGVAALYEVFRQLVEASQTLGESPRKTLQSRRILAIPHEQQILTRELLGLSLSEDMARDRRLQTLLAIDRELARRTDQNHRRRTVFKHLLPLFENPAHRVLYFGPTVSDAELIALLLRQHGIAAGFVSGDTLTAHRRRAIEEFRSGRLQALCNCEVLTTGFDAPQITHVVIARPTVSHVLFEQMVGRGLRGPAFGGTEVCHVLHFIDRWDGARVRLGYVAWRAVWGMDGGRINDQLALADEDIAAERRDIRRQLSLPFGES